MMKSLWFAPSICLLAFAGPIASAQELAKLQVTVKVSEKTPSFTDQRLIVMLYHNHPSQEDRGDIGVARHINPKFSHRKGTETIVTFTIGENVKVKPGLRYTFNATVFDGGSKVALVAERDGLSGPFPVFTNGTAEKVSVLLKPAP